MSLVLRSPTAIRHRLISVAANQPEPRLLYRLFQAQQVCLAIAAQIAVVALCGRYVAPIGRLLPAGFAQIQLSFALAILFSCACLSLPDANRSPSLRALSFCFKLFVTLATVVSFFEPVPANSLAVGSLALRPQGPHPTFLITGIALGLIAVFLLLANFRSLVANRSLNAVTAFLCLLVLTLGSRSLYEFLGTPKSSGDGMPSPPTLLCLLFVTAAVVLYRAETGVFSIVLGPGIGGKMARIVTPVLLLIPTAREACRARMLHHDLIPGSYVMAILSSFATVIGFSLLVCLVSRLNEMEIEIRELTLHDDLTDLYNVKGFNLLAGQSLRMAQRAELPFSVLFIDLDDLKQINDRFGHQMGSALIAETAQVLQESFREADVIARIGGDEFVVAGQLSYEAAATAAERLHASAGERYCDPLRRFPLSLSIGHSTSSVFRPESLKDLVERADQAMYETKRRKKNPVQPMAAAG